MQRDVPVGTFRRNSVHVCLETVTVAFNVELRACNEELRDGHIHWNRSARRQGGEIEDKSAHLLKMVDERGPNKKKLDSGLR